MIAELRAKNGLKQSDLAEKIGVSRYTISNWELGVTSPTIKDLQKIAAALNVTVFDLISNEKEITEGAEQ